MTTHEAPIRGDYRTGRTGCCDVPLRDLPDTDGLVRDGETPSCGLPVVEDQAA